jgi:hypothetical protein
MGEAEHGGQFRPRRTCERPGIFLVWVVMPVKKLLVLGATGGTGGHVGLIFTSAFGGDASRAPMLPRFCCNNWMIPGSSREGFSLRTRMPGGPA